MNRQSDLPPGGNHRPAAEQPGQSHSGLELSHIVSILLDNYRIILGVGIAGLVLGLVLALLTPPQYMASAMLQYDQGRNDLIDPKGMGGKAGTYRPGQEQIATQIGLLYSESLARRVAQDLNLASVPEFGGEGGTIAQRTDRAGAVVRSMVSAEPVKSSMLIRISAVSGDPAMAARVANGVANGHITTSIERKYNSSEFARKFLSDQLARTKVSLEESERNLNSYAISAGIFRQSNRDAAGKETSGESLAQGDLTKLNAALNQAEIDRIAAEQRFLQSELTYSSDTSGTIGTLIQQRATLQAEYNEKLSTYKPDYPAMVELKARVDRLESEIVSERKRMSGNKRAELSGEYKAAVRVEAELRQKVAEAKGEVVTDRNLSVQYNILQREADTNRALYDGLLQRYKEVGVTAGISQSDLSLVDEAKAPSGPFTPRYVMSAIAGLIAGLALGIGIAIARQLLFDTVNDPHDVRAKLKLPMLGAIPVESEGLAPMEALADPKSELSESYHAVRTALRFSRPEGLPKSLLITSTRAGEGKSTSAFAVAKSEANLGNKVLLIDADLRKPTFASARKGGIGFGRLLNSEDPVASAIESTKTKNLSLLPAGSFSGSEVELLSSNRLPSLIDELSAKFDLVVIDGPPILGLADAPLLASVVQATVLVIESKGSRTADIQEMVHRLAESGAAIAGVILTKVVLNRSRYGYGYYKYTKSGPVEQADSLRTIDAV